jgi:putative ABC transport system permease protein
MRWMMRLGCRRQREREMAEELSEHVARLTERNLAAGLPAREARRLALVQFGQPEAIKEAAREQRACFWLEALLRDLRRGARGLRRNAAFSVAAVLTLALGIGASTAMFSLVDGVLLRPLPYPESHRLVRLLDRAPGGLGMVAYHNFLDWQAQQTSFQAMGIWRRTNLNFTSAGSPERLQATQVSAGLFAALGVAPALGRVFDTQDDRSGATEVVVVSHRFWSSRLGGDPAAVGRTLTLDGRPRVLVGVMPPGFDFGGNTAVWESIARDAADWSERVRRQGLRALARLKAGTSLEVARAELDTIAARLEQQYPESNTGRRVQLDLLLDSQVADARRPLWILLGAAAFVLAIACTNVAGLLLARTMARRRELAVCTALGAGRSGLMRQIFAEALLLAMAGGAMGVLLAHGSVAAVRALAADRLPRVAEVALDLRTLLFTVAVSVLAAIGFALLPALRAADSDGKDCLRREPRGQSGGWWRQVLVVGQVALTVVLLVGAGLLLRSFHRLQNVDPGFSPERVLTFRISLPQRKYPERRHQLAFYREFGDRLRRLPGVEIASLASQIPFDDRQSSACFAIRGRPVPALSGCPAMELHFVGPEYFRTLSIPLRAGRTFTADDYRDVAPSGPGQSWANLRTIIVDEEFGRRYFPGEDPVGQEIWWPWAPTQPRQTIIGVVGRVKLGRLGERGGDPQAYFPFGQAPVAGAMTAVLKSALPDETLVSAARRELQAMDPEQPIYAISRLTSMRDDSLGPERLNLVLLGSFAAAALLLALVGLYGLFAYQVLQGRSDIGVRLALGARPGQVLRRVIGRGLLLGATGTVLGLAGALAVSRVLGGLLFEIAPADPRTLAAVAAVTVAVTTLASYLPARRAARLDPTVVLRHE